MFPQTVKNVTVKDKSQVANDQNVLDTVSKISEELGKNGRILLRESGTEPVIRVMVEASSQKLCETYSDKVISLIKELGYSK